MTSDEEKLDDMRVEIEDSLDRLLPTPSNPKDIVVEAARYSLLGGGKRLRPMLALAAAESFGGQSAKRAAMPTACAIEMIHTFSLIHDDLPCMDDDDFRRGKPSLHKAYDEAHAVLAGDLLLAKAFEVIATDLTLTPEKRISLVSILTKCCGAAGLIGGQSLDIQAEGKTVELKDLKNIHKMKTGALITGSLVAGALIGGANIDALERIEAFGDALGLAFQIVDDVLDVTAGFAKRGGNAPSDIANNKATYVTLLGVDRANTVAEELQEEALKHLASLDIDAPLLEHLSQRLVVRKL